MVAAESMHKLMQLINGSDKRCSIYELFVLLHDSVLFYLNSGLQTHVLVLYFIAKHF